jgi:putative FmdB family regulatory protein
MPFYDYLCAKCGATVEVLHGIDEQQARTHEDCGGSLERQFSAASVHFKGSGWAKLDRRSGGSGSSDAPASAPTTPAPAPKSDAK